MTLDPRLLFASVESSNGKVTRWGGDDPDAFNVPEDIEFSTKMPGGYNALNVTLPRPLTRDWPDLTRFSPVEMYGQGEESAFQGYIEAAPRSHGDTQSITPGVVGWAASLRDDPSFREIYRDIELGNWAEPSVQRRLDLHAAGLDLPAGRTEITFGDTGSTGRAIVQALVSPWSRKGIQESWYASRGIPLGRLAWAFTANSSISSADPTWTWQAFASADETAAAFDATGDLSTAATGSGSFVILGTNRVFLALQLLFNAAFTGDSGVDRSLYWRQLAVYGRHGLTLRGAEPDAGFYGSDVVKDVVGRAAPLLSATDADVTASSFIIPHLVFPDLSTAEDVISAVNRFDLNDWGVYDDRKLFYKPQRSYGKVWKLRLGDGVRVEEEGPQAETSFNGVVVQYVDSAGNTQFVGPPGFTTGPTNSALADTSSTNPLNAFGRKKWAVLSMGTTTLTGAAQVGSVFITEISKRQTRGSVVAKGFAKDDRGVYWPVWKVRAGDRVVLEDTNDTSERVIIDTSYEHNSLELTANLDAPPMLLDALLERLQVVLIGVL